MNGKFTELQALKQEIMESLHCALPGVVVAYDSETQTADIQPTVKTRSGKSLPLLRGAPVFMPLAFQVQEGDTALVVFADRDVDAWLESGEESPAASGRTHSLSDGFAFVGFLSGGGQVPGSEGTVDLRNYYTKDEISELLQGVESDISEAENEQPSNGGGNQNQGGNSGTNTGSNTGGGNSGGGNSDSGDEGDMN